MISAGREKDATGKRGPRRQWRLKLAIDDSYGPPQARRALAVARLADLCAMRDALVAVGRGSQAAFLMRKAAAVAGDEEKFQFAIAAANVVMSRPSERASEASTRFSTWGLLARAWGSQELARLYPNAGYGKKSGKGTDEPRIEYLCKYIENVPLATFNDDDYWRAMRPARERCKTDSTFKAYAQVARRVLKIALELRIIPAWPLSAVCKLPIIPKGSEPVFPFLYPEEYCRLMRCELIPIEYRVLWGFIIREGLRLGEAFRIRWEHLAFMPEQNGQRARWVLNVPETKTGRALMFVLNAGSGEVLEAFRRLRPELAGPFVWLSTNQFKKAADTLRRHVEQSGTTRERLLYTEGRMRRLREHDLRSTFVSWCKLAGVDNETIAQHTGHESNAMIGRYNRSKQTIEHLGLAPYLPLDQAMGLDVAGELGAGRVLELGAGGVPELAAELTTEVVAQPVSVPATGAEACNRFTEAEVAWIESQPIWTEGVEAPAPGEGGAPVPEGEPRRRAAARGARARRRGAAAPGEASANEAPKSATAIGDRDSEPLNNCNPCDPGCDHAIAAAGSSPVAGDETSMIHAECARQGSNLHSRGNWNLNPVADDRNEQNTGKAGGEPAPERTGSDRGSHPGVTMPATPLELLVAAGRAYYDAGNWAALHALEPLIDAERSRLAEAARAAPPAPVRLEVVRAQRKGGAS